MRSPNAGFHRLVLGMSLILRPYSPKSSKGLIRPSRSRQSESFAVASLLLTDAGNPNKHRSWSDETRFDSPLVLSVCSIWKTNSIHLIFIMTRIPLAHLELLIDENIELWKLTWDWYSVLIQINLSEKFFAPVLGARRRFRGTHTKEQTKISAIGYCADISITKMTRQFQLDIPLTAS